MKIYTRTGDDGTTGLFGGGRVSKASLRVEAYGTLDEANACVGRVRSSMASLGHATTAAPGMSAARIDALLGRIQSDLFTLGAELATPADKDAKLSLKMALLDDADGVTLERAIDEAEEGVPPLQSFVLPGGTPAAADLHLARCVVRRAERLLIALQRAEPVRPALVVYLNRLSDLLFGLARRANVLGGVADVPWVPKP
ncbi:MAG: cob(I)yrinic acid a,c-diamide adenosyltransferase [Polyangiales bacterium]